MPPRRGKNANSTAPSAPSTPRQAVRARRGRRTTAANTEGNNAATSGPANPTTPAASPDRSNIDPAILAISRSQNAHVGNTQAEVAANGNETLQAVLAALAQAKQEIEAAKAREEELKKQIQHGTPGNQNTNTLGSLIPKPKGSPGDGYSLIEELGLIEDKLAYDRISRVIKHLAHTVLLNLSYSYKWQDAVKIAQIFLVARKRFPVLARCQNNWATAAFLRQYLKNSSYRARLEAEQEGAPLSAIPPSAGVADPVNLNQLAATGQLELDGVNLNPNDVQGAMNQYEEDRD